MVPVIHQVLTPFSISFTLEAMANYARFDVEFPAFFGPSNVTLIISKITFRKRGPKNNGTKIGGVFPTFGKRFDVLNYCKSLLFWHITKARHTCAINTFRDGEHEVLIRWKCSQGRRAKLKNS